MTPEGFAGTAFNQATESENRIHSDEVARRFGFRGGLVPGVTVYAYLAHPALLTWGREWLEGGSATVVLERPLYDARPFVVTTKAEGSDAYHASLRDGDGVVCAQGEIARRGSRLAEPARRGDPPVPAPGSRPDATREVMEKLRKKGPGALSLEWRASGELDRYFSDATTMPDLVRPDRGALANPAFTLGLANWALSANVRLGPWIHVQSEVQHHAGVERGAALVVESRITDLFEKGGHEFVDLDVAVFLEPDVPALSARHRAIYQLRER